MGEDEWPLDLPLGAPDEREAQRQPDAVRAWIAAWAAWSGTGELVWRERRWRTLGVQSLPERLLLHEPASVAAWLGEGQRWQRASSRHRHLVARWPGLRARLARDFDLLADWDATEIERLENLVAWLEANPQSNLYARQLPVAGIDSKWLEGRMTLIADLVAALKEAAGCDLDFYQRCGLKPLPHIVRLFLLDERLRRLAGGLRDISARPEEAGCARSAGIARLHRRELADRLGLRGLSGSGRVHGPWLRRGNAGDSAVGRAGAVHLLG